jgi:hypothetical protein
MRVVPEIFHPVRMLGECTEQVSRVSPLYSSHYGRERETGTLGTGGTLGAQPCISYNRCGMRAWSVLRAVPDAHAQHSEGPYDTRREDRSR